MSKVMLKALIACTVAAAGAPASLAETIAPTSIAYRVAGEATFELFGVDAGGISVFSAADPQALSLTADMSGGLELVGAGLSEAKIGLRGASFIISGEEGSVTAINPFIALDGTGDGQIANSDLADYLVYFDLPAHLRSSIVDPSGQIQIINGVAISQALADRLGAPGAAGQVIGQITMNVQDRIDMSRMLTDPTGIDADGSTPTGDSTRICIMPTSGPDVIVGDLQELTNYTNVGAIDAFSQGTVSCNLGNINLQWIASTNRHPVIPQNMYRFSPNASGATRMVQIGQSWLKHGFFALSQTLCCACNGTDGSALGTGCSDPYTGPRNGQQSNLGPRWEINTSTGFFTYPFGAPAAPATIGRRLQVNTADLASQPAGTLYFVEAQYVSADESTFGAGLNDNNNASHRRINMSGGPSNFTGSLTGTTQRQRPAILAWQDNDATVGVSILDNPGDGRFYVAYDSTSLGGGQWQYEYAVYNLNSGRSGKSFTIPLPEGVNVTNAGFRDVFYHSGDGVNDTTQSGTDWTVTINPTSIVWTTDDCSVNANANALKWGTMYNFWFTADLPPAKLDATLGLFRGAGPYLPQPGGTNCGTGAAGTASVAVNMPAADCNDNNVADSTDIASGTSMDVNMNGVPDECELPPACPGDYNGDGSVGLADMADVINGWGMMVVPPGSGADGDGDGTIGLGDLSVVSLNWDTICP